jgi:hypothetical protein
MVGLGHLVVVLWILFYVRDDFIRHRITEGTGWRGDDDGEGIQAWSQLPYADSGQPSGELPRLIIMEYRVSVCIYTKRIWNDTAGPR